MNNPWLVRRATWGLLLIWIGVMMVIEEPAGVASLGAGAILLGSALFRRAQGWRAGFALTLAGALLILFGLNDLNGDDRGIPLLAVALISFGAMIVVRALGGPRHPSGITIVRDYPPPDDSI